MNTRPLVPPQLVLGIVTFILGAVFLADSAGMLSAESAMALWPIGLVALGLIVVLQPDDANRLVGAVLISPASGCSSTTSASGRIRSGAPGPTCW